MIDKLARIGGGVAGGYVGAVLIGVNPLAAMTFAVVARTIDEIVCSRLIDASQHAYNFSEAVFRNNHPKLEHFRISLYYTSSVSIRVAIWSVAGAVTMLAMPAVAPVAGQILMLTIPIFIAKLLVDDILEHRGFYNYNRLRFGTFT